MADSDTSPSSRHIPAAVRRIVHERDGGRCRYVDGQGRRCTARGFLEFHHRHPFGHGGDHSPEGISLILVGILILVFGSRNESTTVAGPSARFRFTNTVVGGVVVLVLGVGLLIGGIVVAATSK